MKNQLLHLFIGTSICSLFIAPCSSFAQVPNYVPTNGLVGYWPFNGNANDESGNNNGTVNGATLTTDRFGLANKAYSFDGVNDFIELNSITILGNSNRTVSFYCQIPTIPLPNDFSAIAFGGNSASCAQAGGDFELGFFNYNGLSARADGTCTATYSNTNIDVNWHNVVFTYENLDGLNFDAIKIYIDGAFVISSSYNGSTNVNTLSLSNLVFGKSNKAVRFYQGKLDDIGIWNRALTQCEIQDLYHAQLNSAAGISAGPDQTVCEGEFITLNGSGGTNYVWNNSVVDGVPFMPTVSMDYPVLGQDANGCIGTDTMHVELIPTSSSSLTETALDSYTLNGQTYTQSGTYTQVIPNASGCDSTITLNLSLDFTGISELNKDFSIAPNPATNQLIISTSTLSNEKYILFDPQGRKVLEESITGTTTQLDLSKIARGNYLLQIGEKHTPLKLVKE